MVEKSEVLSQVEQLLVKQGLVLATPEGRVADRGAISGSRWGIIWPGRTRAEVESRWTKFWRGFAWAFSLESHRPPRRAFLGILDFEGEDGWVLTVPNEDRTAKPRIVAEHELLLQLEELHEQRVSRATSEEMRAWEQ